MRTKVMETRVRQKIAYFGIIAFTRHKLYAGSTMRYLLQHAPFFNIRNVILISERNLRVAIPAFFVGPSEFPYISTPSSILACMVLRIACCR